MKLQRNFFGWQARILQVAILALALHVSQAGAQPGIILADANSQVSIDPFSQAGMYDWIVDGFPVAMQKQWFWYRVGPDGPERSIDTIPFYQGPVLTDRNSFTDPRDDTFAIKYSDLPFELEFTTSLQGGFPGSLQADITEQIKIINPLSTPLEFHFFQYADFDLGKPFIPGKAVPIGDDDRVQIKLDQVTGKPTEVVQWDAGARVTETIITPDANLGEAASFNFTILKLNDADADNLNGVLGAGPGDVTWAFQWDFLIPGLSSVQISKDKIVLVPEPSVWSFLGLGFLGFCVARGWASRRK